MDRLVVGVGLDPAAGVWVATNEEVSLVAEASTRDELFEKIKGMISDLADLNGYKGRRPVPFELRDLPSIYTESETAP